VIVLMASFLRAATCSVYKYCVACHLTLDAVQPGRIPARGNVKTV
jgi:hypothetical protein